MNVLTRLASVVALGAAAMFASASTAQAGDWGVSIHGGGWNNGWSVNYRDHDRHRGPVYGYRDYRRAPAYYAPARPVYHGNSRYRDYGHRSYNRRDPWCSSHRTYHVHHRNGGYAQGYRNGYSDGYRDGRCERSDYGSAAYYDRIEEMAYDTSIYYGRRW
jgi:hypothetical protein